MKKLKAIVSALLVVVSIFAFTACDATFNGNFKEEATEEQLTQIKNAAGSSYSETIEEEEGHGWIYKINAEINETDDGKTTNASLKGEVQVGSQTDGDGEYAMKLTMKNGDKKFNIENYLKDGAYYLKINDGKGKVENDLTGTIGSMMGSLIQMAGPAYISMYADEAAALTVQGSASLEAAGIKAYVDASGDTFKIKYDFNTDAIKDTIDGGNTEDFKFDGNAKMNVIVVFNKDLTQLKGVRVEMNYNYSYTDGDYTNSGKMKLVSSVQANDKAVKFPNLSSYGDLNFEEIDKMLDSIKGLAD